MSILRRCLREIWKLFVDGSGTATLLTIAWIVVACVILRHVSFGVWSGPILFLGVATITCVGAWRQR